MDWLAFPLKNILVWFFENVLEKLDNLPNYAFIAFGFAAFAYWIKYQIKCNAEAEANPNQLK